MDVECGSSPGCDIDTDYQGFWVGQGFFWIRKIQETPDLDPNCITTTLDKQYCKKSLILEGCLDHDKEPNPDPTEFYNRIRIRPDIGDRNQI